MNELRILKTIPENLRDPSEISYQFVEYYPERTCSFGNVISAETCLVTCPEGKGSKRDLEKRFRDFVEKAEEALKKPVLEWETKIVEKEEDD